MKAVALKLVLRSWWRNKTFSIISIVSLAIGIACTNLLAAFVIYEFNIDRLQFHHHREQEIRSDLDYQDRHYFRPLLRI